MVKSISGIVALLFCASLAHGDNGMVNVQSSHDVKTTADRLVAALEGKGMTVFARIDHAAGAAKTGAELQPTELVIFGNPKVGTPLMKCDRSVAIDLPQKALIREQDGKVLLSYNNPDYLAKRHDLSGCAAVLDKIRMALGNFAKAATQP
jgi:uncharacterized protein (DUF302 family)